MAKFTLMVGEHTIELPEAETREKALLKAGLNPIHWREPEKSTEDKLRDEITALKKEIAELKKKG